MRVLALQSPLIIVSGVLLGVLPCLIVPATIGVLQSNGNGRQIGTLRVLLLS